MKCQYWGECGGCSLPLSYEEQLKQKEKAFCDLGIGPVDLIISSPKEGYRARAEFKIFHDKDSVHLAMYAQKKPILIQKCPILLSSLQKILDLLVVYLNANPKFCHKLFGIEVMGGAESGCLLVLLYHRSLDEVWEKEAQELAQKLGVQIIGRSRGQKIILQKETLEDVVSVDERRYRFVRYDNGFSQPNPYINVKMLEFALSCVGEDAKDLLELYCGGGNFTIPLSQKFRRVFATEVAKSSIKALDQNLILNNINNVFCARLSGEETIKALNFERSFRRLEGIDLLGYEFSHLLIDPPRSGVGDEKMLNFMGRFSNIIYISCNPSTLKKDLEALKQTHQISKIVLFDQFPYTHHLECGVWLRSK
ncbi:tRNA (uridine(54)-C5)-methyltransferase TrmA [Helicobacter kayseriensis]|uniref:tRNA (uridine(54)-C5)-methyltransferase TrmA n=1 Tax=Helicobacter kayseriensis TaxID=2905877 RepID=UPI001E51A231|nr:tRNA (uridine(54)-C5)-methyltransferase TrmA [Helicobacter kayseriensis]MCE3047292.1 tRNA (uridine(54)-C5)-methyltransferase TrmA [Helicobacter kayseriensis]MCE3048663.1 tRNA (uridine(54)-C5)-methyltransferase TrmA [Helicobacter kayseriensis]